MINFIIFEKIKNMTDIKNNKKGYMKFALGVGVGLILGKILFEYVWPLIFN